MVGKAAFVIGADGRPHFVNKIFPTGTKPVYRLELADGYSVDLTADHRVLTANRGDVPAAQLSPNDEVLIFPAFAPHAIVGARASHTERRTVGVVSLRPLGDEPVFDLTESETHHFIANGIAVHNCSEYVFIDDTACNLASLNLVKFLNDDGNFDARRFAEASRIWTTTLEISVTMGQMPSKRIAEKNHGYRTLGLGYANLGTLLMRMGLPYDSEEGFGWCAAITALMTGIAYRTSAEMAQQLGAFARFEANREPMLRVIRNHRRAAYAAEIRAYEGLTRHAGNPRADAVHARDVGTRPQDVGRCTVDRRSCRLPQRPNRRHRSDGMLHRQFDDRHRSRPHAARPSGQPDGGKVARRRLPRPHR